MKPNTILQKLSPKTPDEYSAAETYYNILSSINKLYLTEREVQLIAFIVVKGNMFTAPVKEEFCSKYGTTIPTISNIVSKLKRSNIFIKDLKGKVKVNPQIVLDFQKPIVLQITLDHEPRG